MAWKLKAIFAFILSIAGFNPVVCAQISQAAGGNGAFDTGGQQPNVDSLEIALIAK